jgi:two-component system NtrC family response regulator
LNKDKPNSRKILLVEDDLGVQKQLKWFFDGYEVLTAEDREAALAQVRRHEPTVITLDLGLPPDPTNATEGLAVLEAVLSMAPHTKIIVVTGNDERENAIRAIGLGAYDFYEKPVDPDILGLIVERAFNLYELEEENRRLALRRENSPLEGIVATSPEMLRVCRMVEKVAPTDATVLLLGESGTGKELLARALHELSDYAEGAFVAINCAAIPENLLESELFGYEKGAFTGAAKQTKGKVEYASGGTLFLDEVGDLPAGLQAKLLRFLQERIIERVGGRMEIPVDVRVVCATNQDLAELAEQGKFREDLYYRISEITLRIPPLRERTGDAVVLATHFLHQFARDGSRSLAGFSQDAFGAIEAYGWPGNARELANRVKRAVIMAEGNRIESQDLELNGSQQSALPMNLREVRDDAEQQAISRALALSGGKASQAAELLGVSRPTFYDLLRKHGLK